MKDIAIVSTGSVSSLGIVDSTSLERWHTATPRFTVREYDGVASPVAALTSEAEDLVSRIAAERKIFSELDRTVQLGLAAAKLTVDADAGSLLEGKRLAVLVGSSRGATDLWEHRYGEYQRDHKVPTTTSPLTTLGNVSSWIAEYIGATGFTSEMSVTCSSAMHALIQGISLLHAGFADYVLVIGTEAPLTNFTLAQMRALRLYTTLTEDPHPCRPFAAEQGRGSTLTLGEGAAAVLITLQESLSDSAKNRVLASLTGLGFFRENTPTATAISKEGIGFTRGMSMALNGRTVDSIFAHAPGTVQGDAAELTAISAVFNTQIPALYSNKCDVGHTFGASGLLSLQAALSSLQSGKMKSFPYLCDAKIGACAQRERVTTALVNSAGFGGNHVSVYLEREKGEAMIVCAVVKDLVFISKIKESAHRAGAVVHVVRSLDEYKQKCVELPELFIADLNAFGSVTGEIVRSYPELLTVRTVGFFSHVDKEREEEGRLLGIKEVMPRSKFVLRLDSLFSAHLAP